MFATLLGTGSNVLIDLWTSESELPKLFFSLRGRRSLERILEALDKGLCVGL